MHILKCCAVTTVEEQGSVNNSQPCLREIKNIFHCKEKNLCYLGFPGTRTELSNERTELFSVKFFPSKMGGRKSSDRKYRLMLHTVLTCFHFHFTTEDNLYFMC